MTIKKTLSAFAVGLLFASCASDGAHQTALSEQDTHIEARVDSLVSLLSFEEKLGQMNQISSVANLEEITQLVKDGKVGSILNEVDPVRINALQHMAVEQSKHHIPILIGRDVIHGFKTIFPIPIGQAATFNPEIARIGARVASIEATAAGVRWTFSPMVDIARDARWGRIAEGYGEDVYLTSVMGAATVRGYQGDDLADPASMAACVKHFVGYGACESGRDYNSTFIPERVLRNVYLPPFKASVDAGAATIMTSFNDNDGIPSSANPFILKTVLRDEWNFNGFVVTDWGTIAELVVHGVAPDKLTAAAMAVNAGVDMEMASWVLATNPVDKLIEKGLSKSAVDEAVRNVLRVKFKLGLFENPYVDVHKASMMYAPTSLAAAKEAAIESAILIKNKNNVLPIKSSVKRILVVGPMADAPYEQMGTWAFDGEESHTVTPLAALRKQYGDRVKIDYMPVLSYSRDRSTRGFSAAVAAARRADVVIAFVGEEAILSGEAHSLANLDLVGAQGDMIEALSKVKTPLVSVVIAGRPLTIEKQLNESDAMLYSFHPGTMGGPALAELLMGDAVPSGKTPLSFPRMVGQVPIYYNHHNTGRPSNGHEQLLYDIPLKPGQTSTGCRSFYLDAGETPLLPFGYGLSYTTFEYGPVHLSATTLGKDDVLKLTARVKNTGKIKATEVVQLYIQDRCASVTRPVKELKRFARVSIAPGETKNVEFELPISELAFWTRDMKHEVEAGEFRAWIAPNSASGQPVNFVVH